MAHPKWALIFEFQVRCKLVNQFQWRLRARLLMLNNVAENLFVYIHEYQYIVWYNWGAELDGHGYQFGHEFEIVFRLRSGTWTNPWHEQAFARFAHFLFGEEKVKIWMEYYNDNVLEGHKRSRWSMTWIKRYSWDYGINLFLSEREFRMRPQGHLRSIIETSF